MRRLFSRICFFLFVEWVISDSDHKCSVFRYPKIGCNFWIDKENNFIVDWIPVQYDFGCNNTFVVRLVINRSIGNRRELRSILFIKNNRFYRVGIIASVFSVYDDSKYVCLKRSDLNHLLEIKDKYKALENIRIHTS